jgi:hypothetical protein
MRESRKVMPAQGAFVDCTVGIITSVNHDVCVRPKKASGRNEKKLRGRYAFLRRDDRKREWKGFSQFGPIDQLSLQKAHLSRFKILLDAVVLQTVHAENPLYPGA